MLSESHYVVRRVIRFLMLPYCFLTTVDWAECSRGKLRVLRDFLYIFFVLKDYPDNYGPCRLWERPRSDWALFYGSSYNPSQRHQLRQLVHPYEIERAFRDKVMYTTLLSQLGVPMPTLLGVLDPSEDVSSQINAILDVSGLAEVIIKPIHGSAGAGIFIARRTGQLLNIVMGDGELADSAVILSERNLVQEVLVQSESMSMMNPASINTLRLLTGLLPDGTVITLGAAIRLGCGASIVDNWSRGGVVVGVDPARGTLVGVGFDKLGTRYSRHPTTGIEFSGFEITQWRQAVALGHRVQRYLSFLPLLGMDVAFTPSGPVLIELNVDPDLVLQEQASGPLLGKRENWEYFRAYDLLYNDRQKQLY